MKMIDNPNYDELPKEEDLGKLFSGIGWPDVLLFAIFLVPLVVLPLLPLFATTFRIIIDLITK